MLKVKLPGLGNMKVKVDDGVETNFLPLNSFRAIFSHTLDRMDSLCPDS